MAGRKPEHLPHCGEFWTAEMWQRAREQDLRNAWRRQIPVELLGDANVSARVLAAAAGLLHPPKVHMVKQLDDDTEVETGSTIAVCAITTETSSRLEKYLVPDGRLVRFDGGPRSIEKFDPYFKVHAPLTPEVKKPRVLVLLLMNNDDIFNTIKTIERLVAAMVQENKALVEKSLIFNLIGGVRKTGPLALILGKFCMDLQRSLRAFRSEQSPKQTEAPSKSPVQDRYYALPQWDNVEGINRDTPLRQDEWEDWDDYDEWMARTDHIHKAFTIIPRGDETCVVRNYEPCETYLQADITGFMDACEVALQWPEDKGIIQLGKSVSDLNDTSEESADSSGTAQSIGTTSSISPASSFQNTFDTHAETNRLAIESDIDNPIFPAYREAGELWDGRDITFITICPSPDNLENQPPDFVSQQFQIMHEDLEKNGHLRYLWVNSRDLEQDFAHHARVIYSP